jgi:hypothetical protein
LIYDKIKGQKGCYFLQKKEEEEEMEEERKVVR